MERREFLGGLTVAGVGTVAGCAAASGGPEIESVRLVQPDPRMVSVESDESQYVGTVHNRGHDGTIRAELLYYRDQTVPDPALPREFRRNDTQGRDFVVGRNFFFSEDERREVTINATKQPPEEWETWEFGMVPYPVSYGAVFENTGSSGQVEITLEFVDTRDYNLENPSRKLEPVNSGEELEVMFDVIIPGGVEYEITVEPV